MNPRIWIILVLAIAVVGSLAISFGGPKEKVILPKDRLEARVNERWEYRLAGDWAREYKYNSPSKKSMESFAQTVDQKSHFDYKDFRIESIEIDDKGMATVLVWNHFFMNQPLLLDANGGKPMEHQLVVKETWRWWERDGKEDWYFETVERLRDPNAAKKGDGPSSPRDASTPRIGIDPSGKPAK